MADINRMTRLQARDGGEPSAPREGGGKGDEARLMAYIELLFFAYRDFTSDPDVRLARLGFGRAHHRVLHFVARYPGLRVADLLSILKITKQSLARVLRELIEHGLIVQEAGTSDRRERRLHTSAKGSRLAEALAAPQRRRVAAALAGGGRAAPDIVRAFLYNMISPDERASVSRLIEGGTENSGGKDGETS